MGGNAFKGKCSRLSANRFYDVRDNIMDLLRQKIPEARSKAIESYKAKSSFGDLDILIESGLESSDKFVEAISPIESIKNGPVVSCLIETDLEDYFQVDLIKTKSDSFDFAFNYFSNNDLGNLLGRISHAMGVKFGHDGLWYIIREGTYKFSEICLTKDFNEALDFLMLPRILYTSSFDTLEDIFRFVSSSTFFNPEYFPLEHRSHAARIRDRKRPTYTKFLKWIQTQDKLRHCPIKKDKKEWLPYIFSCFPDFKQEYESALETIRKKKEVKEKFNGKIVMRLTGLVNKELGRFMQHIRSSFKTVDKLDDFMLNHNSDEIEKFISQTYEEYIK